MKYLENFYAENIHGLSEIWISLVFCILSGDSKKGKEVMEAKERGNKKIE